MIRENDLTTFFLTQYLDPDYWFVTDPAFFISLNNKDLKGITDVLLRLLVARGWQVEECYSIIHDEDVRNKWDENIQAMTTAYKDPHIHMAVKFKAKANKGATIGEIARVLGVEAQYVERPKAGRYSWDNQLAYLVHAKDVDKHAYKPEAVYTALGKDYVGVYHESFKRWEKGAARKANKESKIDVDWLERKILEGEVFRPQVFLTDEYYYIYAANKRRIDDAFDAYGQRKMYKAVKALQNGEFDVKVYYVMGKPGSGKTLFANGLIDKALSEAEKRGERWQVCKTASTNPVDDYNGEEILLMDDVRGTTMRADDWLKLLDPHNISPSSARYHNKVIASKVIIITATMQPYEFFYYSKGVGSGQAQEEAVDQFLRRLAGIVEVIDYDQIILNRSLKDGQNHQYLVGTGKIGDCTTVKTLDSEITIQPDGNVVGCNVEELQDYIVGEVFDVR